MATPRDTGRRSVGTAEHGRGRPQTAGSERSQNASNSPWVPAGKRPYSPATRKMITSASPRRSKVVQHSIIFPDDPKLAADDSRQFYWVYGAFDYKMQYSHDQAQQQCFRLIDRQIERVAKMDPPGRKIKCSIIFDIISTKKHILSLLPYELAEDIYRHIEVNHEDRVATSFVGLTDNTARRVGRDVYSKREELSHQRNKIDFSDIDNVRLWIIPPPGTVSSIPSPSNRYSTGKEGKEGGAGKGGDGKKTDKFSWNIE